MNTEQKTLKERKQSDVVTVFKRADQYMYIHAVPSEFITVYGSLMHVHSLFRNVTATTYMDPPKGHLGQLLTTSVLEVPQQIHH